MRTGRSAKRSRKLAACCSGQQRGGHQHGHLLAGLHRHECRAHGDLGLAEAHVAADHAVHGALAGHVLAHGLDGVGLVGGFLEGKAAAKARYPPRRPSAPCRLRAGRWRRRRSSRKRPMASRTGSEPPYCSLARNRNCERLAVHHVEKYPHRGVDDAAHDKLVVAHQANGFAEGLTDLTLPAPGPVHPCRRNADRSRWARSQRFLRLRAGSGCQILGRPPSSGGRASIKALRVCCFCSARGRHRNDVFWKRTAAHSSKSALPASNDYQAGSSGAVQASTNGNDQKIKSPIC